jgi:hypothetical protein
MPPQRHKTKERQVLADRIDSFGVDMPSCSRCEKRGLDCRVSPESTKCGECVRSNMRCDVHGPSVQDWLKLRQEEERLAAEEAAAEILEEEAARKQAEARARVKRLRLQQKLLKQRGSEMLRRGLKTLDELDEVEERERWEREAAELPARATTASSSAVASGDPLGYSGVALGADLPLSPSFWDTLDYVGGTAPGDPHS